MHNIRPDIDAMDQRAPRRRNRPAFNALAALLLSLGVGVTTAVFTFADDVLPNGTSSQSACESVMMNPSRTVSFASASLPSREELRERVSDAYETSVESAGDAIGSIPHRTGDLGDRATLTLIGAGALALLLACARGAASLITSASRARLAAGASVGALVVATLVARALELPPIGPRAIAFALCISLLAASFTRIERQRGPTARSW